MTMRVGKSLRRRLLASAVAALLLPACSHVCHDKYVNAGLYTGFSSVYKVCKRECLTGEKECGCSTNCPCWKAEGHPKFGDEPKKP